MRGGGTVGRQRTIGIEAVFSTDRDLFDPFGQCSRKDCFHRLLTAIADERSGGAAI